jgi:hypothetical protein
VIQDDGPASAVKWSDGRERFIERFSGYESSGEAVFCSQAPDPTGHGFLGREPENQIAQGVRGFGLFV